MSRSISAQCRATPTKGPDWYRIDLYTKEIDLAHAEPGSVSSAAHLSTLDAAIERDLIRLGVLQKQIAEMSAPDDGKPSEEELGILDTFSEAITALLSRFGFVGDVGATRWVTLAGPEARSRIGLPLSSWTSSTGPRYSWCDAAHL